MRAGIAVAVATSLVAAAHAHHGVAGLGVAGIRGPGAPLESTTSSTLPVGETLAYLKLDDARYETFSSDPSQPESDYAAFWITGLGYGFTPWLSLYVFLPYHEKVDEPGGFSTRGFADASVFGQIGIKFDEGFRLIPETESLDDLEDWHLTLYAGLTFPTGDAELRDAAGNIDPGKSTGFGEPSYSLGITATKMLTERWTLNEELSVTQFQEHRYDDGNLGHFGDELRLNSSLIYRLLTRPERETRLDLSLEAQYLRLGRDRVNGTAQPATGGEMLYLLPGVRFSWRRLSVGFGVKVGAWTELNEEPDQQGSEGTEDYRLILTVSALF